MEKTLYLHIGTPKTGTTSIQHFCYNNREALLENGFLYPEFPFVYSNKGKYRNGLFLEAVFFDNEGTRQKEQEEENFIKGLEMLKELFKTHNNIILSDEGIWTACFNRKRGRPLMRRLKEAAEKAGYNIKIIVYLRRQDDFLLSWYNQIIKHNITSKNTLTWEEYFDNYNKYIKLDYFNCLKKLEHIFGKENIIARRFDKNYFKNNSLVSDFLDIFGITKDSGFQEDENPDFNKKISENACEIKRIINGTTKMTVDETRKFEWILREFSPVSEKNYPCSMLSEEDANNIMKLYELSNSKTVKRYIKDGQPLFNIEKKRKEKWKKNNIYMADDIIRFSCMSTLCTMHMIEEQDNEINNIKKIIEHPFRSIFKKIIPS